MLITNHVLFGTVVGLLSRTPGGSLAWGVASHLALDAVPHYGVPEDRFLRLAVRDGLTGLTVLAAIAAAVPADRRVSVLAGITGSCLPDLDKVGHLFAGRSPFPARWDTFHGAIQRESPRYWPVELATGVLSALAAWHLRHVDARNGLTSLTGHGRVPCITGFCRE